MAANALLKLIARGNRIQKEDLAELEVLQKDYPYFLTPYVLASKCLYNDASPGGDNPYLPHAAIRTPDRTRLKFLMENELPFPHPIAGETGVSANSEPSESEELNPLPMLENIVDDMPPEESSVPTPPSLPEDPSPNDDTANNALQAQNRRDILQKLEDNLSKLKSPPKEQPLPAEAPGSATDAKPEKPGGEDLIESIKRKEKKVIHDEKKKEQLRIIKEFTSKNPRFNRTFNPNDEYNAEDLSISSTQLNTHMVSESFAKILVQQNKISEAREIYQKLQLKYPDKKAYFADYISKLEEK